MNVNRSGYYKWCKRKGSLNRYEQDREILSELIQEIHLKHKSYGYHRIAAVIRTTTGWIITDNLVHKCCKHLNIKSSAKHYKYKKLVKNIYSILTSSIDNGMQQNHLN